MKKIDKIYIKTAFNNDGNEEVVVHFDNGTTRTFTGFDDLTQATSFMSEYSDKYGYEPK